MQLDYAFGIDNSLVELDNGMKATVIRRNGADFSMPILRVGSVSELREFDLASSKFSIVRPLADDRTNQIRIDFNGPEEFRELSNYERF